MSRCVPYDPSPAARKLDLTEYEGKVIMVTGNDQGGWLYEASVIDQAGPILTAVVNNVFGPIENLPPL